MKTEYENSLFYQIHSCARCFDILFEQYFKELDLGISSIENLALGIIVEVEDCCYRDLAKILIKDRSNTGKLASVLEKKGFVKTYLKTKNNRPVKILKATKKGIEIHNKIRKIINPVAEEIHSKISSKLLEQTKQNLQMFRKTVEKAIKTNI